MIPLDDARGVVLAGCTPLAPTERELRDALGCVLAETVVASDAVPPFDNSAMDGFAVRADDTAGADRTPVVLEVVGTTLAGMGPTVAIGPGQAVRIMTGAPMPDGADAVVMVERTSPVEGSVSQVAVEQAAGVGDHIRRAGDDVRAGDVVLEPGTVLGPAHLGLAASVGRTDLRVHPRPRVGVLSTGDELVTGGEPLRPGQIHDANRPMLAALLARADCDVVDLGRVPDDDAAIEAAVLAGVAQCDALVSSGGVSMGDVDLVKVVLDRLGEMRWMQVAVRPAKPLAFGTVRRAVGGRAVPVLGLPGNPVSSVVSFELFARPALRKLAGYRADSWIPRPRRARALADLARRPDGKVHFVRVRAALDPAGMLTVEPLGGQGSHQLRTLAEAGALAVLPDGAGVLAGQDVEVLLLDALA